MLYQIRPIYSGLLCSLDCSNATSPSAQLSREELWDLLQATEAELRARLVQAESQRDEFAQQLHEAQHHELMTTTATRVTVASNSNVISDIAPHTARSMHHDTVFSEYNRCDQFLSPECDFLNSFYDDGPNIGPNYCHDDQYATLGSKRTDSDSRRQCDANEIKLMKTKDWKNIESIPVIKKRNSSQSEKSRLLRHSSEDIQERSKKNKLKSSRKKRSISRSRHQVYSCTSSSSDTIADVSYPFKPKTPTLAALLRANNTSIEESTDSEKNHHKHRSKSASRKRNKYRSTSSQPDAFWQRSDSNCNPKVASSKNLYDHVFRSLPDVEHVDDKECSKHAPEFVYSQNIHHGSYDKPIVTRHHEMDDMSCIDVPAPKFDDSSSATEDHHNSGHINPNIQERLHYDKSNISFPSYKRYPEYSGLFHTPQQGFEERKSMHEADLSPLPILKSLHRQQSEQREQQQQQQSQQQQFRSHNFKKNDRKVSAQKLKEKDPIYWSRDESLLRGESVLNSQLSERPFCSNNYRREVNYSPIHQPFFKSSFTKDSRGISSKEQPRQPNRRRDDFRLEKIYSKPEVGHSKFVLQKPRSCSKHDKDNQWDRSLQGVTRSIDDSYASSSKSIIDLQTHKKSRHFLSDHDRAAKSEQHYSRSDYYNSTNNSAARGNMPNHVYWPENESHQIRRSQSPYNTLVQQMPIYQQPLCKAHHYHSQQYSSYEQPSVVNKTSYYSRSLGQENNELSQGESSVISLRKRHHSSPRDDDHINDATTKV